MKCVWIVSTYSGKTLVLDASGVREFFEERHADRLLDMEIDDVWVRKAMIVTCTQFVGSSERASA